MVATSCRNTNAQFFHFASVVVFIFLDVKRSVKEEGRRRQNANAYGRQVVSWS
jgi:hypothetical protein